MDERKASVWVSSQFSSCSTCVRGFLSVADLQEHLLVCHERCVSTPSSVLQQHIQCTMCGLSFEDGPSCAQHLQTHIWDAPGGSSQPQSAASVQVYSRGDVVRPPVRAPAGLHHEAMDVSAISKIVAMQEWGQVDQIRIRSRRAASKQNDQRMSSKPSSKTQNRVPSRRGRGSRRRNSGRLQTVKVEQSEYDHLTDRTSDTGEPGGSSIQMDSSEPEVFTCSQCRKEFISIEELRFHIRSHKFLLCTKCGKLSDSLAKLVSHSSSHSKWAQSADSHYPCYQCGLGFLSFGDLEKHSSLHLLSYSITCDKLESGIYKFFEFMKVVAEEDFDNLNLIPESDEGERNEETPGWHQHQKPEETVFHKSVKTCLLCRVVCVGMNVYEMHVTKKHTSFESLRQSASIFRIPPKEATCPICYRTFFNYVALVQHKRQMHRPKGAESTEFECKKCTRYFVNATSFRKHMEVHEESNFRCQLCKDIFTSRADLDTHIADKHMDQAPKPKKRRVYKNLIACDICEFLAVSESRLKEHMAKHSEVRAFACGVCDMRFKTEGQCKSHMRRSHSDSAYQCDQCTKSFKCPSELEVHLRFHNNIRDYKCPGCGKAFHTNQNMRVHSEKYCKERSKKSTVSKSVSN